MRAGGDQEGERCQGGQGQASQVAAGTDPLRSPDDDIQTGEGDRFCPGHVGTGHQATRDESECQSRPPALPQGSFPTRQRSEQEEEVRWLCPRVHVQPHRTQLRRDIDQGWPSDQQGNRRPGDTIACALPQEVPDRDGQERAGEGREGALGDEQVEVEEARHGGTGQGHEGPEGSVGEPIQGGPVALEEAPGDEQVHRLVPIEILTAEPEEESADDERSGYYAGEAEGDALFTRRLQSGPASDRESRDRYPGLRQLASCCPLQPAGPTRCRRAPPRRGSGSQAPGR